MHEKRRKPDRGEEGKGRDTNKAKTQNRTKERPETGRIKTMYIYIYVYIHSRSGCFKNLIAVNSETFRNEATTLECGQT